MASNYEGSRALVVGGSIGGLTAGLLLRDLGFDVTVVERTPQVLSGRGGGIVLQPDTLRWFAERSRRKPEEVSTFTNHLRYLGAGNAVLHEESVEWRYSSWSTIYRALFEDFDPDRYVLGEFAAGFSQDDDGVDVRFVSGRTERAELVVFADGISSIGRRRLSPDSAASYSGYIGWRGTVPEREVSRETHALLGDALAYSVGPDTHICMYPIPGPDEALSVGERLLNYVWYRNVPEGPELEEILLDKQGIPRPVSVHPGQVQDRYVAEMKEAARRLLAPAAAELVQRTAEPYIQAVLDIRSERMASGRVAVIGDAAFAARPHAAAGTAKAAADAWALAETLEASAGDIAGALAVWEPTRLKIGNALVDRVSQMGARSQFLNTWTPGDPELQFGLYGPGILTQAAPVA
ncbi:FAD-dependent monooxygenase [Georgenia thermotolerans]|uniref:Monooxygenase n=1 Tax=Georgenia thermotolerans TaxID=527326 RepID=A0A7J5UUG6_9MICO|nr:FAD-dependent monooxygenase [Georgenia thermotolerans]KAE8765916.1 monooxygenase [Georgenia thermotolerans]